jgi:hypothetical protein
LLPVSNGAEYVLDQLPAAGEPESAVAPADPTRDILLRADPSDLCARGTRLLRDVASEAEDALARRPTATIAQIGKSLPKEASHA